MISASRSVELELDRMLRTGQADVRVRADGEVEYRLDDGQWRPRREVLPEAVATLAMHRARRARA